MNPTCIKKLEDKMNDVDSKCRNALLKMIYSSNPLAIRINDLNNTDGNAESSGLVLKDYRIRDLIFNDFRTYPSSEEHAYGVSFEKDNAPASLFLIGRNGSGKSTLFSALEMIYSGQSSNAKESKWGDENSYLTYGFGKSDKVNGQSGWQLECKFAGNNEYWSIDKDNVKELVPPSFLCSEMEIEESRKSSKLYEWILKQLGYGKLLEIKKVIDELKRLNETQTQLLSTNQLFTTDDLKDLVNAILTNIIDDSFKRELSLYSKEENIKVNSSYRLFTSLWQKLAHTPNDSSEGAIFNPKISIGTENDDKIKKHIAKLYSKLNSIVGKHPENNSWGYDDVKNLIQEIENDNGLNVDTSAEELENNRILLDGMSNVIEDFSNELVSDFILQNSSDIEEIIRMFSSHHEMYKFINKEKGNIQNLEMQISVENERGFVTSPLEYFNTFRYRLYFVTLKLALSFKWMEHTGIAAPVVIDDVFNASDFDNSVKLESYIYLVKKIFVHACIEKGFEKPLQLIILTHDDMVYNSVKNGFNSYVAGDNRNIMSEGYYPAIYARLYKLEELQVLEDSNDKEYKNVYH